jgi:hypothetical protein
MRFQLSILFVCALTSCSDGGEVAPEFMTIEELALVYERTIGDEVLLEGQLDTDVKGNYFLVRPTKSAAASQRDDFRVQLSFNNDNLDHSLMKPCVGDATIVAGYVDNGHRIRTIWVKRTADVRVHAPAGCYAHGQ